MDRRVEKTRNSIINAFLELRSKKPLEKISVKELCESAGINKSTFYTHFQDIYALSEYLETEVAAEIVANLDHPNSMLTQPYEFTRDLYYAYRAKRNLINILFSSTRANMLIVRIEDSIKDILYEHYPELQHNASANVLITLEIYGSFYAYMNCREFDDDSIIHILSSHWEKTVDFLKNSDYDLDGLRLKNLTKDEESSL